MTGYRHLTKEDRIKIEAWLAVKLPVSCIASNLGFRRSTIYREIKLGQCERMLSDLRVISVYDADVAQRNHDYNATNKGAQLKVGNDYDFVNYVEHLILDKKYSPDVIIGRIKLDGLKFRGMVSSRTLYNYIDKGDIFPNVTRKSLFLKGKRKRNYDKVSHVKIRKPLQKSITERPKNIYDRSECGHWEMDTVIGKSAGKNEVLLVLTERMTRFEIVRKITGKTQAAVIEALDDIERHLQSVFSSTFKTITIDNGCEFLDDIGIERSINGGSRTSAYYCHPYNSCERGSNENANKIIRRFIPKGEDIGNYTHEYITDVQVWMNNYPRKILGYATPLEVFIQEMGFVI